MSGVTYDSLTIWICIVVCMYSVCYGDTDKHGGVKMGVKTPHCDNAEWNINIDWDNSTDYEYKCQKKEHIYSTVDNDVSLECIPPKVMPPPIHKCMTSNITYTDLPPRAGTHRPLWPVYGEYVYVPPQRWIHSLEHGGVVLLYHPCVDPDALKDMKWIVTSCIRRHVITPYRHLPPNKPFAVLTYGCRLRVGEPSIKVADEIVRFIKDTALHTIETNVYRDGDYAWGLIKNATIVSDKRDSILCPYFD